MGSSKVNLSQFGVSPLHIPEINKIVADQHAEAGANEMMMAEHKVAFHNELPKKEQTGKRAQETQRSVDAHVVRSQKHKKHANMVKEGLATAISGPITGRLGISSARGIQKPYVYGGTMFEKKIPNWVGNQIAGYYKSPIKVTDVVANPKETIAREHANIKEQYEQAKTAKVSLPKNQ